jgi:hypothetical protein
MYYMRKDPRWETAKVLQSKVPKSEHQQEEPELRLPTETWFAAQDQTGRREGRQM